MRKQARLFAKQGPTVLAAPGRGLLLASCPLWSAVPGQGLERSPHTFKCVLDVEAFAKAMQSSASPEQEGDGKDKKDEEEDMSLD